jgi:outer membrane lipoprotein-sorting protein
VLRLFLFVAVVLISIALFACGDGSEEPPPAQATDLAGAADGATIAQPGPLSAYYFEASVRTVLQSRSSDHLVIKGWWDAPDRTRWELHSSNDDSYRRVLLVDGDEQWFYEPGTNTYTHGKEPPPGNGLPYPLPSNYQLGLLQLATGVRPARTDTYLGRTVDIYESSSPQVKLQLWIDQEYGVALRQVVESSDPQLTSFTAEVDKIVFNPTFDARAFAFTPPDGSVDGGTSGAAQARGTITPSRGPLNVPAGLLSPSYVPDGYKLESSSQSATAGVTSYIERKLVNEKGDVLTVKEQYRPGGLPDYLQGGTVITVGDGKGYVTRGGGEIILVVYKKDVIVSVSASALAINELRSMVESME